MKRLNPLQWRHLKQLCDKHGIDYQEIDSSLSYDENKQHLFDLAGVRSSDPRSQLAEYYNKNILKDYIMATIAGETYGKCD